MSTNLNDKPSGPGTGMEKAYTGQLGRHYSPDSNDISNENKAYKLNDDDTSTLGNPHGCSWPQIAALLGAEYISLAILSFAWSFSYLGIVGGILTTLGVQALVFYTSYILYLFCLQNPSIKHVCDIGFILFGGKHQFFYEFTMVLLLGNNLFIMALHSLLGGILFNTLTGHPFCTMVSHA